MFHVWLSSTCLAKINILMLKYSKASSILFISLKKSVQVNKTTNIQRIFCSVGENTPVCWDICCIYKMLRNDLIKKDLNNKSTKWLSNWCGARNVWWFQANLTTLTTACRFFCGILKPTGSPPPHTHTPLNIIFVLFSYRMIISSKSLNSLAFASWF